MSGRVYKGLLGAFLAGGLMAAPAAAQAAEATSFEAVARTAEPAPDLDALAATFANDCNRSRREIDRARCRAMQSYVGQKLPSACTRWRWTVPTWSRCRATTPPSRASA